MAEESVIHPGPVNSSLLHKQNLHVSEHVWNGTNRMLRARRARDSRVDKLISSVPDEIVPHLKEAGLYEIACVKDVSPHHELLTALVERWRPETHTFHMPVGECTITLQDVALHLGLRVDGQAVTGVTMSDDWKPIVTELLGKTPEDSDMRGGRLKMSWLNEQFANVEDHVNDQLSLARYARAYMLRLFGGVMFPDSSGSHVPLRFLPLLRNFRETRSYSWGSAVLAQLYQSLCKATDVNRRELTGCNLLIQLWAWDRIRGIGPQEVPDVVPGHPLGARWKKETKWDKYPLAWYRQKLDTIGIEDFVWDPYPEHVLGVLSHQCLQDRALWRAVVPMICFQINEYHQPDRVLRQFGQEQHVPDPPLQDDRLHDISLRGKVDKDWGHQMRKYIGLWNDRHAQVYPNQPVFQRQSGPNDQYMMWYHQHTRRWMTHQVAANEIMAEKLHHVWYMLSREGRHKYSLDLVQQEISRCLAITGEVDRILVPSHDAPAPAMELPEPTNDDLPEVGRKEGQGIQRHRDTFTAEVHTIPPVGVPPLGQYYVPPEHPGAEYMSYRISRKRRLRHFI